METTLTATEVRQQYADVELPLPWKQIQTIVINDKPWFDLAALRVPTQSSSWTLMATL